MGLSYQAGCTIRSDDPLARPRWTSHSHNLRITRSAPRAVQGRKQQSDRLSAVIIVIIIVMIVIPHVPMISSIKLPPKSSMFGAGIPGSVRLRNPDGERQEIDETVATLEVWRRGWMMMDDDLAVSKAALVLMVNHLQRGGL